MITQPASAQPAWGYTADGQIGSTLRECLDSAIAAPSIHNTQPWRFRLFPGGVDVFADHSRRLGVVDPRGREVLISVGAALLNLRIAVLAHGRTPLLQLLPEPDEPDLVARVRIGPATQASGPCTCSRTPSRDGTRPAPFTDDSVPPEVLLELRQAAAAGESAWSGRRHQPRRHPGPGPPRRAGGPPQRVLAGTGRLDAPPGTVATGSRQRHSARGARWRRCRSATSGCDRLPRASRGLRAGADDRRALHLGDGPREWLRAGEALERTLLTACVRGLAATLMTQPVEAPALRRCWTTVRPDCGLRQ
jgi:hypothetical protein